MKPLVVRFLGRKPYGETWQLQRELCDARKRGEIEDTVLLVEHEPVITLGRHAQLANVLVDSVFLAQKGVALVQTDRGGDVTWHGPGQVVAYPILDLRADHLSVPNYIAALENAMIDVLQSYDIKGEQDADRRGVWVRNGGELNRKIGFVGVAFSRYITHHGLSLNVCPDLAAFDLIVPCGLHDIDVTSISNEVGHLVEIKDVFEKLMEALAGRLMRQCRLE